MGRTLANRIGIGPDQRILRLTGDVEATVEFRGRLFDRCFVLVDGEPEQSEWVGIDITAPGGLTYETRLEFRLPYRDGGIRAAIFARFGKFPALEELSLWISDVLVYSEEGGRVLIGGDAAGLPLPSATACVDRDDLPRATATFQPDAETLPRST